MKTIILAILGAMVIVFATIGLRVLLFSEPFIWSGESLVLALIVLISVLTSWIFGFMNIRITNNIRAPKIFGILGYISLWFAVMWGVSVAFFLMIHEESTLKALYDFVIESPKFLAGIFFVGYVAHLVWLMVISPKRFVPDGYIMIEKGMLFLPGENYREMPWDGSAIFMDPLMLLHLRHFKTTGANLFVVDITSAIVIDIASIEQRNFDLEKFRSALMSQVGNHVHTTVGESVSIDSLVDALAIKREYVLAGIPVTYMGSQIIATPA